jgi:hypothetical protein
MESFGILRLQLKSEGVTKELIERLLISLEKSFKNLESDIENIPDVQDTSKTKEDPIEQQAEIVKGLILQGAYKIARDFINFIEEKAKKEKRI